jgi:ankyrin repeat protein
VDSFKLFIAKVSACVVGLRAAWLTLFNVREKKSVNVNAANELNETPLHKACLNTTNGRILVQLLTHHAANLDALVSAVASAT